MVQRTERQVRPSSTFPERVNDAFDYGLVDPNTASQTVCLAVIFAISLGKRGWTEVRGFIPRAASSLRVLVSLS